MPVLDEKGCPCGHCCCQDCSCGAHYDCPCDICGWNGDHDGELWPEEEQAIADIHSGKTKMVTMSGDEFIKELE